MASTVTVRSTVETRDRLARLAEESGTSSSALLAELTEQEEIRRWLAQGAADLDRLVPHAETTYLAERREWLDAPLVEPFR